MPRPSSLSRRLTACVLALCLTGLSGCAWLPGWAGGGSQAASGQAQASDLVIVQYRQGPRSFAAQTANEAVGVRLVQTLGVIDGALVEPPAGMSAAEAAAQLRRQPGVINAQPQAAP